MGKKATAADLGSHSAKLLVAEATKHGVRVLRFAALPREADDATPLSSSGIGLAGVVCGLAGRDMTLRYSQVPPTPDWQLRNLMDLEIQDLSQQSGGSLSADYNLLPSADPESGVDTVLLALAKDEGLERLQTELRRGNGSACAFTPNCTALYNAYLKCGPVEPDAVVCLANIGHETIDLALVRGTDLLFARNLSGGSKVFDDAIAASFQVSARKAAALKHDLLDLDPASRGRYSSGQAEKVTMAASGAASTILAAIQSSVSFCKAQTKLPDLRLDKVLVTGGGARVRGLRGLLRENLRCPVEPFDAFANLDLSALPPAEAEQLDAMRLEAVVALGLAVGRLDDTLYSLEILPAAVKRRQVFQQRTIWNILAGLLAVLLLVLVAQDQQQAAAATEGRIATLKRRQTAANNVHKQASEAIEANKTTRAVVEHFAAQAMPGNALLRSVRAAGSALPPQLWLTRVEVGAVGASSPGQKRRTAVLLEGAGKEIDGVDSNQVFDQFVAKFRREMESAGYKVTMVPSTGQGSLTFKITVEPMEAS